MTPQPHPLRCETCTHLKKHDIHGNYCDISGRKSPQGTLFMERVAELGCASHSSRPATTPDETISSLISENARIGAELKRALAEVARLNGSARAAIIAQARGDVLNEMRDLVRNAKKYGTIEPEEIFHYTGILSMIESLRSSTKEQP